jgi:hypothetical protein
MRDAKVQLNDMQEATLNITLGKMEQHLQKRSSIYKNVQHNCLNNIGMSYFRYALTKLLIPDARDPRDTGSEVQFELS